MTYVDVTDASEKLMRELFATEEVLSSAEVNVRNSIAHAVLRAWFTHARELASAEVHASEYERLAELARELPLTVHVQN